MGKGRIAAGAVLALLGTAGLAQAIAPGASLYVANIYVTGASGSGCLDTPGSNYLGVANYPGLSGTRIGVRVPISGNVGVVSILIFSVTSGRGTTQPAGTFTWKIRGQQSVDASGTFSATITEIDKYSFIVSMRENYSNCSETQTISLTNL